MNEISKAGSPPHGRGKGHDRQGFIGAVGITPAWAGKSGGGCSAGNARQDHPRVGGEKPIPQIFSSHSQGSPPRGRGKVGGGKAMKRPLHHPRVGGEKCCPDVWTIWLMGSPPHGRGKAPGVQKRHSAGGITPAWAGKSLFCFAAAVPIQDHPRVGGEKLYCIAAFCSMWGSPPHGRGKATWHCVRRPALRITPAHAGKRTRSWRAYGCPWDHPRTGGKRQPRRPSSRDRRDHPRVGGEKKIAG